MYPLGFQFHSASYCPLGRTPCLYLYAYVSKSSKSIQIGLFLFKQIDCFDIAKPEETRALFEVNATTS
jgi:hypothetical protein